MSRTRIGTMFPSKYLKPADLEEAEDGELDLTITGIDSAELGTDDGDRQTKWVVSFKEHERGLVLNKTNADRLAELCDSDVAEDWIGHRVRLYIARVAFRGKEVDGIRIKAARRQPPLAETTSAAQ